MRRRKGIAGSDVLRRIAFDGHKVGEEPRHDPSEARGLPDERGAGLGFCVERLGRLIPAFTNHSSSRAFSPNIVKTASEPMATGTFAWMARRRVSRFLSMKGPKRARVSARRRWAP
jgi:hypothetical protein